MSMSESEEVTSPVVEGGSGLTSDEITESFEAALEEGTVTDILGNPMGKDDFVEVDPSWGLSEFIIGTVLPQIKHLQGRVLTIIDASFVSLDEAEAERKKYVKDLVKDVFNSQADNIFQVLLDHNRGVSVQDVNGEALWCKNGRDGVSTGCTDCPK